MVAKAEGVLREYASRLFRTMRSREIEAQFAEMGLHVPDFAEISRLGSALARHVPRPSSSAHLHGRLPHEPIRHQAQVDCNMWRYNLAEILAWRHLLAGQLTSHRVAAWWRQMVFRH